jgi:hypothetical protein
MAKYKRSGEHFIQIPTGLLNSPAWRVLSSSSKALFLDMRTKFKGANNGNIEATLSNLKHHGWVSATTLSKALKEIQVMGFIVCTRRGGIGRGVGVCSLYRFTDLASPPFQDKGIAACAATKDYAKFATLRDAETALLNGMERLKNQSKSAAYKKIRLQKLDHSAPVSGQGGGGLDKNRQLTAPDSGQGENVAGAL